MELRQKIIIFSITRDNESPNNRCSLPKHAKNYTLWEIGSVWSVVDFGSSTMGSLKYDAFFRSETFGRKPPSNGRTETIAKTRTAILICVVSVDHTYRVSCATRHR